MALTFSTGMTKLADAEATGTAWFKPRFSGSGQDPAASLDTTIFKEGSGSIGGKLAGNNWNAAITYKHTVSVNLSTVGNEVVGIWVLMTTPGTALPIASDGGYILIASSTEAYNSNPTVYSEWTVTGSEEGTNGWRLFLVDTRKTPTQTVGGGASLSAVTKIGFGIRSVSSVGNVKADNCYVDAIYYGRPVYTLTGDGALTATWDDFLQDSLTNTNGLVEEVGGSVVFSSGIAFGTDAQTSTTDFDDATGTSVVFKRHTYENGTSVVDALNYADYYSVVGAGAASFGTSVKVGSVVGSGDNRQGILGGSIKSEDSANMTFSIDFQTDISHLTIVQFYGTTVTGAKGGCLFDGKATAADSSVISGTFVNCGEVDTGGASNGVELLSASIIDPDGDVNNYGLTFSQIPSVGAMTTRVKKVNLITSGTPTTQYMLNFPYTGDYTVTLTDVQTFGSYVSGTIWHGINTGTNADVTISSSGTTNLDQTEFSNTAGGTVSVVGSVPITITVQDEALAGVDTALVRVEETNGTLISQGAVSAGVYSDSFSGTTPVNVVVKIRSSSDGETRYVPIRTGASIDSGTGLVSTYTLTVNPLVGL